MSEITQISGMSIALCPERKCLHGRTGLEWGDRYQFEHFHFEILVRNGIMHICH